MYCAFATGSPHAYEIYLDPPGNRTGRWAEIDSLRGNTWFECKCGYEFLLGQAGTGVSRSVLADLTHQVLNHKALADECGLEYRYVVSSELVRDILEAEWHGNITIWLVPWEGCDPTGEHVDPGGRGRRRRPTSRPRPRGRR